MADRTNPEPPHGPLDNETNEGQPIESGGWWTPYVETPWGYFRFAVRAVEQPDGVILFWHDAEGAHSQSVVTDLPGDKVVLARLSASEARVAALTEAVEGLRKDHDAQRRIGVLGPDGHAGAWAALGAVLGFLEGKPITPPPFDYEDHARRRAALRAATPEAPEPRSET